ncbi:hypothetical protein B0H14DRAFT_2579005 [Mycena olivaceomarginata]|nr:hypothetical protein B0H14DRAFT_2579005 [Mycena olivaceomarginata]
MLQFFREFILIFAAGMGELGGGGGGFDGIDGKWRGPRLATSPPDFDGSDAGVMGEPTPRPPLPTISVSGIVYSSRKSMYGEARSAVFLERLLRIQKLAVESADWEHCCQGPTRYHKK